MVQQASISSCMLAVIADTIGITLIDAKTQKKVTLTGDDAIAYTNKLRLVKSVEEMDKLILSYFN